MILPRQASVLPLAGRCTVLIALALSTCARVPAETPAVSLARPCPQWVEYPLDDHSNAGSPFLGCTNAANLQSMLDRPSDLDHGRELGPASGAREALGVRAYDEGQIKPFTGESPSQAKPTIEIEGSSGAAGP